MVRFQFDGPEMRFFSANTMISWSFVGTVAGEDDAGLHDGISRGCMGLTIFMTEVVGSVVFCYEDGGGGWSVLCGEAGVEGGGFLVVVVVCTTRERYYRWKRWLFLLI